MGLFLFFLIWKVPLGGGRMGLWEVPHAHAFMLNMIISIANGWPMGGIIGDYL